MRLIRWLFGRGSMSRIDPAVLIIIVCSGMPIWAMVISTILWVTVAVLIETALFGEGYHARSKICQMIAENLGDVPDNS